MDIKIGMIGITVAALSVLLLTHEQTRDYLYFTIVLIVFICSLMIFFLFMNSISKKWFIKGFLVNAVLVILLPIVEGGMFFLIISVCFLAVLAFAQLAMVILCKGKNK